MTLLLWLGSQIWKEENGRPAWKAYWVAIALSGLIFGWAHVDDPAGAFGAKADSQAPALRMIWTSLFGCVAGWLTWRFGLESAMLWHILTDALATALLVPAFLSGLRRAHLRRRYWSGDCAHGLEAFAGREERAAEQVWLSFIPGGSTGRRGTSMRACAVVLSLIIIAIGVFCQGLQAQGESPVALGDRRELFVDGFMIDTLKNLELRLHRPHREGTALRFDAPWEGGFSGYVAVLNDEGVYRMYYRGAPGSPTPAVVCYAESRDGVLWEKPSLGIYEVMGTRENNVILADAEPYTHNFCPFIDTRPGVPPAERFKALAGDEKSGLVAFVSTDGIHWRKLWPEPVLTGGMFDSQNVAFWSEAENQYLCYFRTWTGEGYTGFRTITRSTSSDFSTWSDPVEMTYGDTPQEHLYTNATTPYYRAPHIYLAFPKRFFPEKAALSPEESERLVQNPKYRIASSDAVFMSTRGGNRYDRTFMEAFIRPGPTVRDWVARDNTPALGIIPANEREIFLYRMSHYAQPTSHVTRYSLRVDGFVSVHAPYEGGELLTRRFTFSGSELELNFAGSPAGGLRVEIQDGEGTAIPGYRLEECPEMIGDVIDRVVRWEKGSDLAPLAGQTVRLRVVMRDTDLYAFRFR